MNPPLKAFVSIHGSNCILTLSKIKQVEMGICMEVTREFCTPDVCDKFIS
jgi:hypothetical protein